MCRKHHENSRGSLQFAHWWAQYFSFRPAYRHSNRCFSRLRACHTFAAGFNSETDMVGYVPDVPSKPDSHSLRTKHLLTRMRLLVLVQEPPSTQVRKCLHDQVLRY